MSTTAPAPEPTTTSDTEAPPRPTTVAEKAPSELFKYARYVHVGPGAEECDEGAKGTCQNPLHFHGWVRQANQIQAEDIRQRANAAKARMLRQLRDEDSDAFVVLESEIDQLRAEGDRNEMVEELLAEKGHNDILQAFKEINEFERFEHIAHDQERLRELQALPDDRQEPTRDERESLERHLDTYGKALDEKLDEIRRPRREALEERPTDELVNLVKQKRISQEASMAWQETWGRWEAYIGTLKPVAEGWPSKRVFATMDDFEATAPEVVLGIRDAFTEIDAALYGTRGNS